MSLCRTVGSGKRPVGSCYSPSPSPHRPHVVFSEGRCKRLRVMSNHRAQLLKASKSGVILQPSFNRLRKVELFSNPATRRLRNARRLYQPSFERLRELEGPRRPFVVFSDGRSKRLRVMSDHRTQVQKASKSGVILQPSFKRLRKEEQFSNPATRRLRNARKLYQRNF